MPERRPFDPSRIRVPDGERLPGGSEQTITPSRVNALVRVAISEHIPATLHVLGEIGNLSRPQSGHLYFSLKDDAAELRCVMWRSAASKLKFEPETGMEVVATGGLEVYAPRGTYQLLVRKLEPRGVGALELAFRQLREKLEQAGWFDPDRKRKLPATPERIAVITSPSGAAVRDIIRTLARRFPAAEVLVFPTRVQGDGAAAEIATAIKLMNRVAGALGGIDVAIVARGGGSLEDLWAFNEEAVARAIYESRVPIVSGVGHEVDITIADLVADVRAATPTAAAELVAPPRDDLLREVDALATRAGRCVRHRLEVAGHQLEACLRSDWLARPITRVRLHGQRVDESLSRVQRAIAERLHAARHRLAEVQHALARLGTGVTFVRAAGAVRDRLGRIDRAWQARLRAAERGVERRSETIERMAGMARLARYDERLRQTAARLEQAIGGALRQRRAALEARTEVTRACDPRRVLRRGYSLTRDARSRRIIRSVTEIRDKMRIITELADGEFRSTADDPRQPGLFDQVD